MLRVALGLITLITTGCYIVPAQTPEPATAPPPDPAPAGPQSEAPRDFRVAGVLEFGQSADGRFAGALGSAVGYLVALGQGGELRASLSSEPESEIAVYGPLQTTWREAALVARAAGEITTVAPAGGTYLVGVFGPVGDQSAFTLEVQCGGDGCRLECGSDHTCPPGGECQVVHCVRDPCPSYCDAVANAQ